MSVGSNERVHLGARCKSQAFLGCCPHFFFFTQDLSLSLELANEASLGGLASPEASTCLHLPRAGIASVCTWVCFHKALGISRWFSHLHFMDGVISPALRSAFFAGFKLSVVQTRGTGQGLASRHCLTTERQEFRRPLTQPLPQSAET